MNALRRLAVAMSSDVVEKDEYDRIWAYGYEDTFGVAGDSSSGSRTSLLREDERTDSTNAASVVVSSPYIERSRCRRDPQHERHYAKIKTPLLPNRTGTASDRARGTTSLSETTRSGTHGLRRRDNVVDANTGSRFKRAWIDLVARVTGRRKDTDALVE